MPEKQLAAIYEQLKTPVLICRKSAALPVVFLNPAAKLLFAPHLSLEILRGRNKAGSLASVLRFKKREMFHFFRRELSETGAVSGFDVEILSFQGDVVPARLHANVVAPERDALCIIYVDPREDANACESDAWIMNRILNASHGVTDFDEAIQRILELAGMHVEASRAFIMEDKTPASTGLAYEWRAEGQPGPLRGLENLDKSRFSYRAIMNDAKMLITNDARLLPAGDREILGGLGIRAMVALPLYHLDNSLGFVVFGDCQADRQWTMEEIRLLQNVSSVVASLINRRNAEKCSRRALEVFRTVIENLEELVFITDPHSYELRFVSKSLTKALCKSEAELLGVPCWSVLHSGFDGPCPFCPLPGMRNAAAEGPGDAAWEIHHEETGKWFMAKNTLIDWIDGGQACLGTLVDITYRKQYEERLKRFAAIDALTEVYTRKWGYDRLADLFEADMAARAEQTLCFVDIDGLKVVNDCLGHAAGDAMILSTLGVIHSCIRREDFVSRWGGDEFVVFLNCCLYDAQVVLDKIYFGLEHFNASSGKPYQLSISIGLVDFSEPWETLDALIDEADRRMYENKSRKRRDSSKKGRKRGRGEDSRLLSGRNA